ncbi:MAG: hypothetical protein SFV22_08570, partial [Saprospiraceae bacterium]|nr:hypothetical protein [Saprospiraceae bacterium]
PLISDVKIISAGLKLRVTPGMLRAMPVPEVVKINSTGKKGELRVQLATPVHLRLMHASEYSLDGGNSWHNSQYYYRRKFVLTGLPSSLHLLVRFRTLGANGMTGESTEPLEVAVL